MASLLKSTAGRLLAPLATYFHKQSLLRNHHGSKVAQLTLAHQYRILAASPTKQMPTFADVGFRELSEFEEDGILLYLFSLITPRKRVCIEICAGNGIECNTANLIVNHGWWGHLFDGNAQNVALGRSFYRRHRDTFLHPPTFTEAWITAENVNQLVQSLGLSGPIDLLSLDIDGMDYWVWKALDIVEPTVVVCEINNAVASTEALTVPYDPRFIAPNGDYRGASLKAMCNLARDQGYRLVGTHRFGFNAFFVKNGVREDLLPEVSPEDCAGDPFTRVALSTRWSGMSHMPWTKV